MSCVSAAPGTLWLLTGAGAVYVREGVEQSATGTAWVPLDLLQMGQLEEGRSSYESTTWPGRYCCVIYLSSGNRVRIAGLSEFGRLKFWFIF